MKNIIKTALAVSLISSIGCWSAENTNTANTANTATVVNTENMNNVSNSTAVTNSADMTNSPSEMNAEVSGSPIETLKKLNTASKAKDSAAIQKTLSKGTIALIEQSAANQKKTIDQLLKEEDGAPFKELPEMRNEKINGDTATIEVKNKENGEWLEIPFVVENGEWKAALDVLYQNLQQQFLQEQQKNAPQ